MTEIQVRFFKDDKELEGVLLESGVTKTKVKTSDGVVHIIDTDFVKIKKINIDCEYAEEWLETMATYYKEADVSDIDRQEVNGVVKYIKQYIPYHRKGKPFKYEDAISETNRLINKIDDNSREKSVMVNIQKTLEEQQEEILKMREEIQQLKSKPGIAVSTPLGNICAYESSDPSYPGIFVEVEGSGDGFSSATLVEYQRMDNQIKVHAWKQSEEDPVTSFRWDENQLVKVFSPETD